MPELIKTIEVMFQAAFGLAFELLIRSKKYILAIITVACGHFLCLYIGHWSAVPIRPDDSSSRINELQEKINALVVESAHDRVKGAKESAKAMQDGFQKGFDSGFAKARQDSAREHYLSGQAAGRHAAEQEFHTQETTLKKAIRVAEDEAEHLARTNKRLFTTISDHESRSATMAQILESLERQLKAALANNRQGSGKNRAAESPMDWDEPRRTYVPAPVYSASQERDYAAKTKEEEKFQMDRKAYLYMIYKK